MDMDKPISLRLRRGIIKVVFSLGKIFLLDEEIIPFGHIMHHGAPKLGQIT